MSNLQEEILSIQDYFRSVEYFGNAIVVKVEFPDRWHVFSSDDNKIKAAPDDNIPNIYFYYTDIKEGTLEDVFELIRKTVETNVNAVKKVEMMKTRLVELKEIFASHTIDELQKLKFVFEEDKPKRKYNRKKKQEEVIKEETTEVVEETNG